MAKKIFSFVEKPGVTNPEVVKIDNSITDDVVQLGNIGTTYYFSFDDSNGSVEAVEESELKIYDMENEDDLAHVKSVFKNLSYPMGKILEMEREFVDSVSVYVLVKALKTSDQSILDKIDDLEDKKDQFLQSLGFPGTAIL